MEKVHVLMFWAPLLLCCLAEQQYFPQPNASAWEQARHHCQVCYKELVTLTPNNIQIIVRNLSSDYWIGLRKKLNKMTAPGCTMPWSFWANGDPLTFQNWYPGRPMANLSGVCPKCECCCPSGCRGVGNRNAFSTVETMTAMSTMTPTNDTTCEEDVYLEDPCVAMLSFGAWFEKNCLRHLPYICYEDRFYANATVSNVTINGSTLHWLPGPGDISRYRLEVRKNREKVKDDNLTKTLNESDLTYDLVNLIAGTLYLVQIFPIKCERDLNAENVTFYTKPDLVTNLRVTSVTETSASLSWSPPRGNLDFYYVEVSDEPNLNTTTTTEEAEVKGLIPGVRYTFDIIAIAGAKDKSEEGVKSEEGEPVSTTTYTKPSTVYSLTVSDSLKNSLQLSWEPPKGNHTGYRVTACYNETVIICPFNDTLGQSQTSLEVTDLPAGTKMLLSVAALSNGTLEGDHVTVFGYTAPNPVKGLDLSTTTNSLNASWHPPEGNYEFFTVVLSGQEETKTFKFMETRVDFSSLRSAAYYTVTVAVVNGHLMSEVKTSSKFTLPVKPQEAKVTFSSKTNITLEWVAPPNTLNVTYRVSYLAEFWGEDRHQTVVNDTKYVFEGLRTGTKYDFEVRTLAGILKSEPVKASKCTVPEEEVLTLSLQCSTTELLHCERGDIPTKILEKLEEYFKNELTTNVFWRLKWKEE